MNEEFSLKAVLGVDDKASGPIGQIKNHFENLKSSIGQSEGQLKSFNKHLSDLKTGAKFLAVGLVAGGLVKSLVKSTLETGKLKAEIKGLGVSGSGIKSITASANEAASQFGTSREAFLKASYDIRSGISSLGENDLGKFTALVAKTASAGKADIAQMGSAFASVFNTFRNQYKKESDFDFGTRIASNMAFAINQFKTDGAKLQSGMEAIGASAAAMGVSLEEQTVVLGSLMNTSKGEVSGTSLRSFLDKAGGAASKMGLSFTNAKGHLLPVADILDKIKGKFPDLKSAAAQSQIKKAFGSDEAVKVVQLLGAKTGDLRTKLSELKNSMQPGGKNFLDEMARINTDNTLSEMEKLSETWKGFKEVIGEKLSAPFGSLVSGLKNILYWLSELLTRYPSLASITGYLIAGVAGFALFIGTIKTARATMGLYRLMTLSTATASKLQSGIMSGLSGSVNNFSSTLNHSTKALQKYNTISSVSTGLSSKFKTGLTSLGSGIKTLGLSIWGAVKSTWAFTIALLANPITWIVLGIAALVAALVGLVVYWDEVTAAVLSSWEWIKNTWGTAPGWFKGIVALLMLPFWPLIATIRLIATNWDQIKTYVSSSFASFGDWIGTQVAKIIEFLNLLWKPFAYLGSFFGTEGQKIGTALTTGIKKSAKEGSGGIISSLKSGLSSIGSFVFGSGMDTAKTFASGIKKGSGLLKSTVQKTLKTGVRNQIPSSDAKEGPLSSLTKSGMSFTKTFASGITKASPDLKSKAQQLLGSINLTPQLPKLNTTNENNLVQNFQKSGGANITTGSLITLNINGSSEKIAVNALSRKLAELLMGEINKLEVY